jgi:hypothetical protein
MFKTPFTSAVLLLLLVVGVPHASVGQEVNYQVPPSDTAQRIPTVTCRTEEIVIPARRIRLRDVSQATDVEGAHQADFMVGNIGPIRIGGSLYIQKLPSEIRVCQASVEAYVDGAFIAGGGYRYTTFPPNCVSLPANKQFGVALHFPALFADFDSGEGDVTCTFQF